MLITIANPRRRTAIKSELRYLYRRLLVSLLGNLLKHTNRQFSIFRASSRSARAGRAALFGQARGNRAFFPWKAGEFAPFLPHPPLSKPVRVGLLSSLGLEIDPDHQPCALAVRPIVRPALGSLVPWCRAGNYVPLLARHGGATLAQREAAPHSVPSYRVGGRRLAADTQAAWGISPPLCPGRQKAEAPDGAI